MNSRLVLRFVVLYVNANGLVLTYPRKNHSEFIFTSRFTGHSEYPNGRYRGDTRRDNLGVRARIY
jgi:hypothetical protein